jgi:GNAT superfamily N-acetyltransferase
VIVARVTAASLSRDAVLHLYGAVGWTAYTKDPDTLIAALEGSTAIFTATDDATLVGLARVISDGATICYLQDLLVHPASQRQGIGRALVTTALAAFPSVRQKVLLTDDEPGQRAFYEALGFAEASALSTGVLRAFVRFD